MRRLILFILLFVTLKVSAQTTYWTPGVPPSSTSFTPSFRFKAGVSDSVNNLYISNGNKWYQVYTAAQANARFTGGGGGTSTGINGLNGTTNIGLGGTLTGATYIHNGGYILQMDTLQFIKGLYKTNIRSAGFDLSDPTRYAAIQSSQFWVTHVSDTTQTLFRENFSYDTTRVTGVPIRITPKVSFAAAPQFVTTGSTAGYVWTETDAVGNGGWAAPAGGSTGINGLNGTTNIGLGGTLSSSTPIITGSQSFIIEDVSSGTKVSFVQDGTSIDASAGDGTNAGSLFLTNGGAQLQYTGYGYDSSYGSQYIKLEGSDMKVFDGIYSLGLQYYSNYTTNQRLQRLSIPSVNTVIALADSVKATISGGVSTISGVAANGFTWSIANPTTTPAITLTLQNATTSQAGQVTATDWNTFNGKQAALVSGTNIKTINSTSLLGSGNIVTPNLGNTDLTVSANRTISLGSNSLSFYGTSFNPGFVIAPTFVGSSIFDGSQYTTNIQSDNAGNIYFYTNDGALGGGYTGLKFGLAGMNVGDDIGSNGLIYTKHMNYAGLQQIPDVQMVDSLITAAGGGGVTAVTGTPNRITSTGGTTPHIDISATFEALLGKVASPLSQFASTTSAQLATVLSDESGTGFVAYTTNPVFTTPNLGTPSALVGTNITGTASGFTAGNVTTNANQTGDVTSVGNATTISNSVALPGSPTTTTQISSDNSTKIATTAFVQANIPVVTGYVPYTGATGNVNLGTNFIAAGASLTPLVPVHAISTISTNPRGILSDQNTADAVGARITMRKSRGTPASPSVITTGDVLGSWTAAGYTNAYTDAGKVLVTSTGTISNGIVPSIMELQTMNAAGTLTDGIKIDQVQQLTFGGYSTTGLAHLSSSGVLTSSLLVNADITAGTIDLTTKVTGLLPIANGGTGTSTPGIVAGTNITVSGSWPNQTINATGGTYSAGTGLTLTGSTFSVNTSQNITTLSNLTSNGLVKTTGGTGALSIATANTDYLPVANPTATGTLTAASLSASSIASTGSLSASATTTISIGSITTGHSDGALIRSTGGTSAGTTVRNSPDLDLQGDVWNTTSVAASNRFNWSIQGRAVSGLVPTTSLFISSSLVTGTTPSFTDRVSIDNTGNVNLLTGNLNISALTASKPVFTDASKNLTSTGPGTALQLIAGDGSLVSVPITQSSANLTAQTAAGNITTFTVGASTATFDITGYINITAVTADVIELQVTYTDENNTAQTANFFTQGATSALLSAIGNSAYPGMTIRAKNATVITVKSVLTTGTGSIQFDDGAAITQR